MGRQLLGYRVRAVHDGRFVYTQRLLQEPHGTETGGIRWTDRPTFPREKVVCRSHLKAATIEPRWYESNQPIDIVDVKIVAVYLKTDTYTSSFADKRAREDLSDFCRAVWDEIDRRNIDAFVETEGSSGLPTTLCFRAVNNDFVWVPIVRYAVVDGPKETRASRTVDRMLFAIGNVARSLPGVES